MKEYTPAEIEVLVPVVRCKDCIYAEGIESSQFRFCVKHAEFVPLNGYCFEARGSQ